jgi:hypothetical protein
MSWSDLDIDKEVVLHFEIKTAPFIILIHVSLFFCSLLKPNRDQYEAISRPKLENVGLILQAYEHMYRD